MGKNFLFVAGDIGAARMQLPVIRELVNQGHRVDIVADGAGMAQEVFRNEKLDFMCLANPFLIPDLCRNRDLIVVGTSASANRIEWEFFSMPLARKTLMSDGYFNHGMRPWRDVQEGIWFAIDEGHAQAIWELRPFLKPDSIRMVGQPAFDAALVLEPRKHEIRAQVRKACGIDDSETVYLWWSQGMPQVIEEDIEFLNEALAHPQAVYPVLIARIHPKLDKIWQGYVGEIRRDVSVQASKHGFRVTEADKVPGEELCLAADVILSITCTEDIKSTMIGGPPVVHFLGPRVRGWFEKDFGLEYPYLPDVKMGISLGAISAQSVPQAIHDALKRGPFRTLSPQSLAPATKRMVAALLELIS